MSIDRAAATLKSAQAAINDAAAESWDDWREDGEEAIAPPRRLEDPDAMCSRLMVADLGGLLAVHYYGSDYVGWDEAMDALAQPGVAEHVGTLHIDGPDEGANGLTTWDFSALIAAAPRFSRLTNLVIPQSDTGDHNQKVVEDGQLPALIALMPTLKRLTLPQSPEADFFALDLPALRWMQTGRSFRTHDFIDALAQARGLSALSFVDFSDSLAPLLDIRPAEDPEWDSTPFEAYERLFRAPVMEQFWGFRIRGARLSEAQCRQLQAIRPTLQLSVALDAPHCYVSHWGKTDFPYRHLLPFG